MAWIPVALANSGSSIDRVAELDYLARRSSAKHYTLFAKFATAQFETGIGAIKTSTWKAGDFATAVKTRPLSEILGS